MRQQHTGSLTGRGVVNPVVLGRKFCGTCGRWRLVCDFPTRRRASTGLASSCRTCLRLARRAHRERMTDEDRERRNEYWRIWAEAKRREAGKPRAKGRRSVVDKVERQFFDTEPLVAAILADGREYRLIASLAGVGERAVNRLVNGESRHVRLDLADKLAVGLDIPLALIYGDTPTVSDVRERKAAA